MHKRGIYGEITLGNFGCYVRLLEVFKHKNSVRHSIKKMYLMLLRVMKLMKPSFFSYMHENTMKHFLADPYREMLVSKGRLR